MGFILMFYHFGLDKVLLGLFILFSLILSFVFFWNPSIGSGKPDVYPWFKNLSLWRKILFIIVGLWIFIPGPM
jgi:hypothetical protein